MKFLTTFVIILVGFLIHNLCALPTPGASEDMMNITAVASHPGYLVLNVSATGCKENKNYDITVKSCRDEVVINKVRACEDLTRGTLICFNKKEECVTIHSDGVSSNNVTFKNLIEPENRKLYSMNWNRQWDSNVSTITVERYKTAAIYGLVLSPITTKSDESKGPCLSKENVNLDEVIYPNLKFFVDWNKLDKNCSYTAFVQPRNHCRDSVGSKWKVSTLHYTPIKSEEELEESTKMIPLVISVIVVTFILSFICLLWFYKMKKLQNDALVNKKPTTEEDRSLVEMAHLSKRTVLVVYAMDVKKKVADLITLLKKETSNQILDLYDHTDGNKLANPLVWLTNKFHDPFTRIIIVASRGAKRLQELHNSTVPSDCSLCGQTDDEVIRQEREVFHFLLIDVLHKLKDSHLNQDYTRFFHIKFIDIPNQVELDYVTPDCVYQLPRHSLHLIDALNQP